MSSLETKEVVGGSFAYETKRVVSEKYNFEWTIRNFTYLIGQHNVIEKPFFPPETDSEHKWFFKVEFVWNDLEYPHSKENEICFTLRSSPRTVKMTKHADISVCLKSFDHVYQLPIKEKRITEESSELLSFSFFCSTFCKEMKWNNLEFYSDTVLDAEDVFSDPGFSFRGCKTPRDLTIICEVNLADSIQDFRKEKKLLKFSGDISDHRNSILNDDSFKDFSFFVQDQTFHVSKLLLALESPVFAAMFRSNMSEGMNSEATIKDVEPKIFLKMIEFIYEQKVDQADLEELAPEILKVAHIYDVMKLKEICASFMYEKLSVDNAVEILELADFYSINVLKQKALKIVKLNLKLLKGSEGFENLFKKRSQLAFELLEVKEDDDSYDYLYTSLGETMIG